MIADLFGSIGWAIGLRSLGLHEHGFDLEPTMGVARERLGLGPTTIADLNDIDPRDWRGIDGLIGSPPCQTRSAANSKSKADREADPRHDLIWIPLKWAKVCRPRWVALEQVPGAAPEFERIAYELDEPAPTITVQQSATWARARPSTTVCADNRVTAPGHHNGSQNAGAVPWQEAGTSTPIKLTREQGAVLMGMPWVEVTAALAGMTQRQAWALIGNAVCPPMATALVQGLAQQEQRRAA